MQVNRRNARPFWRVLGLSVCLPVVGYFFLLCGFVCTTTDPDPAWAVAGQLLLMLLGIQLLRLWWFWVGVLLSVTSYGPERDDVRFYTLDGR